jgi:hypothetical protein
MARSLLVKGASLATRARGRWLRGCPLHLRALSGIPGLPEVPDTSQGAFGSIGSPVIADPDTSEAPDAPTDEADALVSKYIDMGLEIMHSSSDERSHYDLRALTADAHRFDAEFGADPTSPTAFGALMKHFYVLPRPECLVPAFVSLLGNGPGLTGESQAAEALFLGRCLGQLGPAGVPLGVLMLRVAEDVGSALIANAKDDSERQRAAALHRERREGMLFVMLHSGLEPLVQAVEQAALQATQTLKALEGGALAPPPDPEVSPEASLEAATGIARETVRRMRALWPSDSAEQMPVQAVAWPLPGLPYEEPAFFDGCRESDSPPWARSSQLLTTAMTARDHEAAGGMDDLTWHRLGHAVGCTIQDCMWAEVYALGDVLAVRKCVAAAAEWLSFADEFGPEHVLDPENTPIPADFQWPTSAKDASGTREVMRFHLSRRAMSRLLREASQHPLVCEVMELERRDLFHLAAQQGTSPLSASAKKVGTFIESLRPLVHLSLAHGRASVPAYAEAFSKNITASPSFEPLLTSLGGVPPPGGLVAMGWALPPMVSQVWDGGKSLPPQLQSAPGITDDQVVSAIKSMEQFGRTDSLIPMSAAQQDGLPDLAWEFARDKANRQALEATVAHTLFDAARRSRETHDQQFLPPGAIPHQRV